MMLSPLQQAERHLSTVDPVLAPLIQRYGPCPLAPAENFFSVLCKSIVSQQLSTKVAQTLMARLQALVEPQELQPPTVLTLDSDTLRGIGLSRSKAEYLLALAQACHERTVDLAALPSLNNEAIIQQLVAVRGVGRWTAEMFLIFGLTRLDVLSTGDYGIRKAMQTLYGLEELPKPAAMRAIAQAWQPYESVASWYLWRSLPTSQ